MIASDAKCRGMMTSLERVMRSTTSGMTSLERVPKQQPNLHSHQLQQPNLHSHRLLPACCSYPWTSWQQPIVSSVIMIVPQSAVGSGCKSRHCLQSQLTVAHTHTSSTPHGSQHNVLKCLKSCHCPVFAILQTQTTTQQATQSRI